MKKFLTLAIACASLLFATQTPALASSSSNNNEYKQILNSAKKRHNAKDAEMLLNADGSKHILLSKKVDGKTLYGIASTNGSLIIPIKYEKIEYYPSESEGIVELENKGRAVKYYKQKTAPVFVCKNDIYYKDDYIDGKRIANAKESCKFTLLDDSGNLISDKIGYAVKIPGY